MLRTFVLTFVRSDRKLSTAFDYKEPQQRIFTNPKYERQCSNDVNFFHIVFLYVLICRMLCRCDNLMRLPNHFVNYVQFVTHVFHRLRPKQEINEKIV